jgi:hypothetical protein
MTTTKTASQFHHPLLGIFWFLNGKLLKAETVLEEGIENLEAISAKGDHINVWPILQRQNAGVRNLEYEEVPRGRIVFMKKPKKFRVYMDKTLHTPAIKKLILAEFRLPKTRTQFFTDPHYTIDPADLDRLFGSDRSRDYFFEQQGEDDHDKSQ